MAESHFTKETEALVGTIHTVEDAIKAHHLASADPEKDGTLTGPVHEEKYGLERAAGSRALWEGQGLETATPAAPENAAAPRPKQA